LSPAPLPAALSISVSQYTNEVPLPYGARLSPEDTGKPLPPGEDLAQPFSPSAFPYAKLSVAAATEGLVVFSMRIQYSSALKWAPPQTTSSDRGISPLRSKPELTMIHKHPTIEIELDPGHTTDDPWIIDELTINPFIHKAQGLPSTPTASLWAEVSLRCLSDKADYVPPPPLALRLKGFSKGEASPTCRVPDPGIPSGAADVDMNFILHSDIWYSFVATWGIDAEFMSDGYRSPIRVLYPCPACESQTDAIDHITSDTWVGAGLFERLPKAARQAAISIQARATDFHINVLHQPFARQRNLWQPAPTPEGYPRDTLQLSRLTDGNLFAPVIFERPSTWPRYRFAIRRMPWGWSTRHPHFESLTGISYGGTAAITSTSETDHILKPRAFSLSTGEQCDILLQRGEAIRFWTRWNAASILETNQKFGRLRIRTITSVRGQLLYYNMFPRIPGEYEFRASGGLDLQRYAAPPRLFFLWDVHTPEECYSTVQFCHEASQSHFRLSADFMDKDEEGRRLVDLFAISVVFNLCAGALISLLWLDPPPQASLSPTRFSGPLAVGISSAVCGLTVVVGGILRYRGSSLSWRWLFGSLGVSSLAGVLISAKLKVAGALFLLLTPVVFLRAFGLTKHFGQCVASHWPPPPIDIYFERRRYISQIKGDIA